MRWLVVVLLGASVAWADDVDIEMSLSRIEMQMKEAQGQAAIDRLRVRPQPAVAAPAPAVVYGQPPAVSQETTCEFLARTKSARYEEVCGH